MDTEKLLNIVNTYDNGNWSMNSYRSKMFEEYIKDFMKEVNAQCKQAGWKQRNNLVRYETARGNGKVFCLVSPDARVVLELGKFDLLEYVKKFEENKELIRTEALQFVADFPNLSKKFDPLIEKYVEFMKERPGYIEKDKIKVTKRIQGHEVIVLIQYRGSLNAIRFNIYKKVEDYPLAKICRAQSNGITGDVAYDIANRLTRNIRGRTMENTPITQAEQDFAVKHMLKGQDSRMARELVDSGKLSQDNLDKLNGLLMVATINSNSRYSDWGSPF